MSRIEETLLESLFCESRSFVEYKVEITEKLSSIDPNILGKTQSIFYKRLVSPLDDRVSWIKSVADVALGNSIDSMLDQEEPILFNTIKDLCLGLIKASEIGKFNQNSGKGKLYSIRFFSRSGQFIDNKLIIESKSSKKLSLIKDEIKSKINTLDSKERKELLVELLSKEMEV